MNPFKYAYCLLMLCFLLTNCEETIDFEPPKSIQNAIFIEGKLTKGTPSNVFVKIGQVFNFSSNPSLLLAQSVHLMDESGQSLELTSREQGIFKLTIPDNHPTFKVDYGKAYKIRLQLKNQELYESNYDTLYQAPIPTDLTIQKVPKVVQNEAGEISTAEFLAFNISTPFLTYKDGTKTRLLWEFGSVFKFSDTPNGFGRPPCRATSQEPKTCYVSFNPVANYTSLNTNMLSGNSVKDYTIYESPNLKTFVYAEGYYLSVYQQAISEQAYEYWRQINLLTNRDGSIFEQPSGKIITNFRNLGDPKGEIYGFFYATEEYVQRIYVSPDFAGNPDKACPQPPPSPICDNCLCQENSTTEKPDWWIE